MKEQIKQTIIEALRFQFDHRKTQDYKLIELMEAMQPLDHEKYLEMKSDLISEGIINE